MASKGDSNGWEMTSSDKRCLLMTRDGLTATNFHRILVLCHLEYYVIILTLAPKCCLLCLFKGDLKGFKRVDLFKTDICSDLYDTMYWNWQSTFFVQETTSIGVGPLHFMNGNMNKLLFSLLFIRFPRYKFWGGGYVILKVDTTFGAVLQVL